MQPVDNFNPKKFRGMENSFQEKRRQELREFYASGYAFAKVEISGTVTMSRERECYKRAVRQLWRETGISWTDINFHVRNGELFVERAKKADDVLLR